MLLHVNVWKIIDNVDYIVVINHLIKCNGCESTDLHDVGVRRKR